MKRLPDFSHASVTAQGDIQPSWPALAPPPPGSPDLNALIIRGTFRFQLPGRWHLVSASIITANWNAPSSQRWLVPLGGGPGITFDVVHTAGPRRCRLTSSGRLAFS